MWTLDYQADIESDLSAFHRIDDPMTIPGPRYFALVVRLAAYAGVLAARAEEYREREKSGSHGAHSAAQRGGTAAAPQRVADDAALAMLSDGWVEHTTSEEEG